MPYVAETIARLKKSAPAEVEFYQAVEEVLTSLRPLLDKNPKYRKHGIIAVSYTHLDVYKRQ